MHNFRRLHDDDKNYLQLIWVTYSMCVILTTSVNSYLSLKFAELIKESEARRHLLIL